MIAHSFIDTDLSGGVYHDEEITAWRGRGSFANDRAPLCPLQNVGGIKIMSSDFARIPLACQALKLLGTSPLPPDIQKECMSDTPNSQSYRHHLDT